MAELEVDPLTSGLSGNTNLPLGTELLLGCLPLVRVHAAVDLAGRIAPASQVLSQVGQGVAMLSEDKQLAPAVLQFGKLSPHQAFL